MTDMKSCIETEAMVDFLYGEADADARSRVEAHLHRCVRCADEVRGLKEVRGTLEAWTPPDAELGFQVVAAHPEPAAPSRWGRLRPAWGLAAAAVVVVATAAAITKPELEIGRGEMVLRIGWSDSASDADERPDMLPASPSDRATLAAADDDEALGLIVRQLLRDEEIYASQRRADLSELQRAFGEFEGTGAEPARQQVLDYLRRVSAR